MKNDVPSQPKERLERSVIAQSKWITVYKDRVLSNGGYDLEYWCVDRSDSVIIIVKQGDRFLLPAEQYRPGIDKKTLDFPGGRVDKFDPIVAAEQSVRREFQLEDSAKLYINKLLENPLIVDSAFSNQKVYGFIAEVPEDITVDADQYTCDQLLEKLECLQCRAMLLEQISQQQVIGNS